MHGNQWVLKIAVLKYYSVSKRGTTAKSNPKQATDPISLHTKFGDNSSNTFPLNERKPCVTPDIGRRTPDIGHRTAKKAKIIYPPPRGVDIIPVGWRVASKKGGHKCELQNHSINPEVIHTCTDVLTTSDTPPPPPSFYNNLRTLKGRERRSGVLSQGFLIK